MDRCELQISKGSSSGGKTLPPPPPPPPLLLIPRGTPSDKIAFDWPHD